MKEDCFAFNKQAKRKEKMCNALRELVCDNNECSFYKTKEQFKKDARAAERKNGGLNQYVK